MDDSGTFYDAEEYFDNLSDISDEYHDAEDTSFADKEYPQLSNGDMLLHRLAFDGDVTRLEQELKKCTPEERTKLDNQGNTILHLGVLRRNKRVVEIALEAGISSKTRNSRGWTALDEAIGIREKDLVCLLYLHAVAEVKTEMKAAKVQLMQTLNEMPDYSMELSWQLGSAVIGYLLRKFAPHDTYKIYKLGSKIRVDGTLLGVDKTSSSFLPEWKRGEFSLLFDGTTTPSLLYLVFHEKKEYLDLTEEKMERKRNGQFDFDVDLIMADGAGRTKLRATDFRFKPVKGWLSSQQTEKIEDWNTKVYEASGKMTAVTRLKSKIEIPPSCTFEEYLKLEVIADTVVETAVNPPGLSNHGGESRRNESGTDSNKSKAKKLTGRCWMAEDFPMSLRQLLPLLDVVGHANKHLSSVSKFMRKYGDMNMFPVRIQIPLLLTVYLLVSFKRFKFASSPEGWCDLPKDYKRLKLDDVLSTSSLPAVQRLKSFNGDISSNAPKQPTLSELEKDAIDY